MTSPLLADRRVTAVALTISRVSTMREFSRIKRLPPYVFSITAELKMAARRRGEDIIDMSMGNPDGPTPQHITDKLVEAALRENTHGYSISKGIPRLRKAICDWYQRRYDVSFDPESEAVVTIGSKEGLAHLMLATLDRGDTVLVPNPSYPIHIYGAIIAGADIRSVRMTPEVDFIEEVQRAIRESIPKPKMMILGFPSNPTARCVDLDFFERIIALARQHDILVVHDLAYADIVFDGYQAPSIMQVPGARESRSSSSPCRRATTWPAGGSATWSATRNCARTGAHQELSRLRHLHADPGRFGDRPRRSAAMCRGSPPALSGAPQRARQGAARSRLDGRDTARLDVHLGESRSLPAMGSLEFAKKLLAEARVAVSPGVGFGEYGDDHVRFALIENEERTRQAVRGIKDMFRKDGLL
jgi:alanine-synthesizing transaminase